jgi:hypothetical protein
MLSLSRFVESIQEFRALLTHITQNLRRIRDSSALTNDFLIEKQTCILILVVLLFIIQLHIFISRYISFILCAVLYCLVMREREIRSTPTLIYV